MTSAGMRVGRAASRRTILATRRGSIQIKPLAEVRSPQGSIAQLPPAGDRRNSPGPQTDDVRRRADATGILNGQEFVPGRSAIAGR